MKTTLKQKMWIVAAIHFALTVLATVWMFMTPFGPLSPAQDFVFAIKFALFALLQPQLWVPGFLPCIDEYRFGIWIVLISVPLWSLCFGWLFVRLDNWLNHFPMLGKKVF